MNSNFIKILCLSPFVLLGSVLSDKLAVPVNAFGVDQKCINNVEQERAVKVYDNGLVLYGFEQDLSWSLEFRKKLPEYVGKLSEMQYLLSKNNIDLYVIPIPNRLSLLTDKILLEASRKDEGIFDDSKKAKLAYNNLLDSLEKNKIKYISVVDAVKPMLNSGKLPVFLDEAHWNEDGAKLVARVLSSKLQRGNTRISTEAAQEVRTWSMRPIANIIRAICGVRINDVGYKDYKFYTADRQYVSSGFSYPENAQGRWALGEHSKVAFDSTAGTRQLQMSFKGLFPKQDVKIVFNGKTIYNKSILSDKEVDLNVQVDTKSGRNLIYITSDNWNLKNNNAIVNDSRQLSLLFNKLAIDRPETNLLKNNNIEFGKEISLLDDDYVENILLGTSYSEEHPINNLKFADFIRMYTKSDLLNYSKGGGGISVAMRNFLQSNVFTDKQKHTLIYEFLIEDLANTDALSQIINELKFLSCKISNIHTVKYLPDSYIRLSKNEIYKVEYEDKTVLSVKINTGSNMVELVNSNRQDDKNIFYFGADQLASNEFRLINSEDSVINLSICRL